MSKDSLLLTIAANLTREMNISWENRQQLIADQASLDYALSYSNRTKYHTNNSDLNSILIRTSHINKVFLKFKKRKTKIQIIVFRFHLNCMIFILMKKNVYKMNGTKFVKHLKKNILKKMNVYQENFINYLKNRQQLIMMM